MTRGLATTKKQTFEIFLMRLGRYISLESEYYAHIGGMQQLKSGVLFRRITLRLRNRWSDCGSLPICSFGQSDAKGESSEIVSNLSHTIKFKFLHLCFSGCMWPYRNIRLPPPIGFGWALWKSSTGKEAVLVSKGKEEIGLGQNGRDLIV